MRFRLRTLLIVLALGPAVIAAIFWGTTGFDKEMAAGISTLIGLTVCVPAAVLAPLILLIVALNRFANARRSARLIAKMNKTLNEKADP